MCSSAGARLCTAGRRWWGDKVFRMAWEAMFALTPFESAEVFRRPRNDKPREQHALAGFEEIRKQRSFEFVGAQGRNRTGTPCGGGF